MNPSTSYLWPVVACVPLVVLAASANGEDAASASRHAKVRGALVAATEINQTRLRELQVEGLTSVAIVVDGTSNEDLKTQRQAANLVLASSLELYYWIEIARCPALADEHPEWMASLQTHEEWRRYFPNAPRVAANEVAKTYPWVPILSREPFTAQLKRVKILLADKPRATGILLNDLQGAPSACGCGNPLCRWTSDYGNKRTTTPLGNDAATLFVAAVKELAAGSNVIPVWTTECEQHDGQPDGLCAGVGCYDGICWKAYTRQLMPLAETCEQLAAFVPFREFQRDLPIYGDKAGWIRNAVESFSTMPAKHDGKPIRPSRLITVIQGWNVQPDDIAAQIRISNDAGASGYFIAYQKIDQSWQPRIVPWR